MIDLSIIIPCYNSERFICELLDSIKIEKIPNYEIIIIDDGSTDNTLRVVREYIDSHGQKNSYIVVSQKNQGVSTARNRGLELASGNLIAFLDSDDMVAEYYFDIVYQLFYNNPSIDASCCYRSNNINKLSKLKYEECKIEKVKSIDLLREYTYSKKNIVFPCFVYKSTIIKENDILFSDDLKYGEDWEFVTKVLSNCKKSIIIKNVAYWYRVSQFSATRNVSWRQTDAIIAAKNTIAYLQSYKTDLVEEFRGYLYARAVLSVLHRFALERRYDLFKKTYELYYNRSFFISFLRSKIDFKSRVATVLLIISYKLFYILVR